MLTLLYISYVCSETHQNALAKKRSCQFFSSAKVLLINNFQFQLITRYILYNMFVYITSKPIDLDQRRMRWIRINSVGKKNLLEKIKHLAGNCH